MNENVVWPAEAVNVCLVLSDGNVAHSTPLPVVFRYWPFVPVPPPAVIVLSNFAVASNSAVPVNVVTPATLTLSKFVCPSTSKSPFKSEFPSITKPSATTLPVTLIPVFVVENFIELLKYKSTWSVRC